MNAEFIRNVVFIFAHLICIGADDTDVDEKMKILLSDDNSGSRDFYKNCFNGIYRQCRHRSEFSDYELESVRKYIQNRFYSIKNPDWAPVREPCKKLRVAKDWKCLTAEEKSQMLHALRILYKQGVNEQLSVWPHAAYWGGTHKFVSGNINHRWYMVKFEEALRKVNPSLSLPYWNPNEEYDHAEWSIIYDDIGHAGDAASDYCVKDGPFVDAKPCVKRQWLNDTYMPPINPVEMIDASLQNIKAISDLFQWQFAVHFKTHLAIGGAAGQMTAPNAPYDNTFQLFHVWYHVFIFLWQLQDDDHLMPVSYDGLNEYDWEIDGTRPASLATDTLLLYENVTIKEVWQIGFGDLCTVPDLIVERVLSVIGPNKMQMPLKYQRMPKPLLKKYFPNFYYGNYTALNWLSSDVPDECNRRCRPVRQAQDFVATPQGLILLDRIKWWAHYNLEATLLGVEPFHKQFTDDLNSYGYCSPYIIS